jgi:hypothetical protein
LLLSFPNRIAPATLFSFCAWREVFPLTRSNPVVSV